MRLMQFAMHIINMRSYEITHCVVPSSFHKWWAGSCLWGSWLGRCPRWWHSSRYLYPQWEAAQSPGCQSPGESGTGLCQKEGEASIRASQKSTFQADKFWEIGFAGKNLFVKKDATLTVTNAFEVVGACGGRPHRRRISRVLI